MLGFVLIVSFLSNVSPFVGASYTLVATFQLSLLGFSPVNFALVVLVSAAGATLAKVVIYYGAFGLRGKLTKNKNVQLIGKNSSGRRFYLVLFATALLPILPLDDFIYIGAGASGASIGRMAGVTLGAKVVKSALEVTVEYAVLNDIGNALGFGSLEATVILGATFLILGFGLYRMDWQKAFQRLRPTRFGRNDANIGRWPGNRYSFTNAARTRCGGRPAWSTARGLGPRPLGVRGFESHPPHYILPALKGPDGGQFPQNT